MLEECFKLLSGFMSGKEGSLYSNLILYTKEIPLHRNYSFSYKELTITHARNLFFIQTNTENYMVVVAPNLSKAVTKFKKVVEVLDDVNIPADFPYGKECFITDVMIPASMFTHLPYSSRSIIIDNILEQISSSQNGRAVTISSLNVNDILINFNRLSQSLLRNSQPNVVSRIVSWLLNPKKYSLTKIQEKLLNKSLVLADTLYLNPILLGAAEKVNQSTIARSVDSIIRNSASYLYISDTELTNANHHFLRLPALEEIKSIDVYKGLNALVMAQKFSTDMRIVLPKLPMCSEYYLEVEVLGNWYRATICENYTPELEKQLIHAILREISSSAK